MTTAQKILDRLQATGARNPADPPPGYVDGPLCWNAAFDETWAAGEAISLHNFEETDTTTPFNVATGTGSVNAHPPAGIQKQFPGTVGQPLMATLHLQALTCWITPPDSDAAEQDVQDIWGFLGQCDILVKNGDTVKRRLPLAPHVNIRAPKFYTQAAGGAGSVYFTPPEVLTRDFATDIKISPQMGDRLEIVPRNAANQTTHAIEAGVYLVEFEFDGAAYTDDVKVVWPVESPAVMEAQRDSSGFNNPRY